MSHSDQLQDPIQRINVAFYRVSQASESCVLELVGETRAAGGAASPAAAQDTPPQVYHSAAKVRTLEGQTFQLLEKYGTSLVFLAPAASDTATGSMVFSPFSRGLDKHHSTQAIAHDVCEACAVRAGALAELNNLNRNIWGDKLQGTASSGWEVGVVSSARILFVQLPDLGLLELVEIVGPRYSKLQPLGYESQCAAFMRYSNPCRVTLGGTLDCSGISSILQAAAAQSSCAFRVSTLNPATIVQSLLARSVHSAQGNAGTLPHMLLLLLAPCGAEHKCAQVQDILHAAHSWVTANGAKDSDTRFCIVCSVDPSGAASLRGASPSSVVSLLKAALAAAPGQVISTALSDISDLTGMSCASMFDDVRAEIDSTLLLSAHGSALFAIWATRMAVAWGQPPSMKVIAVDADNTLWAGVLAEVQDGDFSSLAIRREHLELQKWLKAQSQGGVQLVLLTNNNATEVEALLDFVPLQSKEGCVADGMPLQRQDFIVVSASWRSKAERLHSILGQMSLSSDQTLFIDDSHMEIAAMQQILPAVACVRWPQNTEEAICVLSRLNVGDTAALAPSGIAESRRRTYKQVLAKSQAIDALVAASSDQKRRFGLEDFFSSLAPVTSVHAVSAQNLELISRFVELSVRSNQFINLKTIWTSASVGALLDDGAYLLCASVADKFGPMQNIAFIFATISTIGEICTVKVVSFALSCRAMGRGVEYALLSQLAQNVPEHATITIKHHDSGRNIPFLCFLNNLADRGMVVSTSGGQSALNSDDPSAEQQTTFNRAKLATFRYTPSMFAYDTIADMAKGPAAHAAVAGPTLAAAAETATTQLRLLPVPQPDSQVPKVPSRHCLYFSLRSTDCFVSLDNGPEQKLQFLNRREFEFVLGEVWPTKADEATGYSSLISRLPADACVFDIGANVGLFSCLALSFCPSAHIVAVEPARAAFRCLQTNLAAFQQLSSSSIAPRLQIFDCACGRGELDLHHIGLVHSFEELHFFPHNSILSFLGDASAGDEFDTVLAFMEQEQSAKVSEVARDAVYHLMSQREVEPVPVASVGSLWRASGKPHVHVLKVDVEGSEVSVLQSVPREMLEHIDSVVVECRIGGDKDTLDAVATWLFENSFAIKQRHASVNRVCIEAHNAHALWPHLCVRSNVVASWDRPRLFSNNINAAKVLSEGRPQSAAQSDGANMLESVANIWAGALKCAPQDVMGNMDASFQQLGGDSLGLVQLISELRHGGFEASFEQPWLTWSLSQAVNFLAQDIADSEYASADMAQADAPTSLTNTSPQLTPQVFVCGPAGDFREQLACNLRKALELPPTTMAAQVLYHSLDVIPSCLARFDETVAEHSHLFVAEQLLEHLLEPGQFRRPSSIFWSESIFLSLSILNHLLSFCILAASSTDTLPRAACIGHCIGTLSATAIDGALRTGRLSVLLHNVEAAIAAACVIGCQMDIGSGHRGTHPEGLSQRMLTVRLGPEFLSGVQKNNMMTDFSRKSLIPGTRLTVSPCVGHLSVLSSPRAGAVSFVQRTPSLLADRNQSEVFKHAYHTPLNLSVMNSLLDVTMDLATLPLFVFDSVMHIEVTRRLVSQILCIPFDFVNVLQQAVRQAGSDAVLVDLGPGQAGPGSAGILAGWAQESGRQQTVVDAGTGLQYSIGTQLQEEEKARVGAGDHVQPRTAPKQKQSTFPVNTTLHTGTASSPAVSTYAQKVIATLIGANGAEISLTASWWDLGLSSVQFPVLLALLQQGSTPLQNLHLGELINARNISGLACMEKSQFQATQPECEPVKRQAAPDKKLWLSGAGFRLPGCNNWSSFTSTLQTGAAMTSLMGQQGCFLRDEALHCSVQGFGVSSRMDAALSLEHSLALQAAWEAGSDSAVFQRHDRDKIGVFVGLQDLHSAAAEKPVVNSAFTAFAQDPNSIASLVAAALSIRGPTETVQAACASSLVAVCAAANAIRCGHVTAAFVIAVQVNRNEGSWTLLRDLGVLNEPGIRAVPLHAFGDEEGCSGFHRGEGCICVVLESALHVPRELSCELAGWASGFVGQVDAPHVIDVKRCQKLMEQASGHCTPTHIEMHATGTMVGDALELEVCEAVSRSMQTQASLGVTKGAFGHTEAASGLVSLCAAWANELHVDPRAHKSTVGPFDRAPHASGSLVCNLGFSGSGAFIYIQGPPASEALHASIALGAAPQSTAEPVILWSQVHPQHGDSFQDDLSASLEHVVSRGSIGRAQLAFLSQQSGQMIPLPQYLPAVRLLLQHGLPQGVQNQKAHVSCETLSQSSITGRVLVHLSARLPLVDAERPVVTERNDELQWMKCFAETQMELFDLSAPIVDSDTVSELLKSSWPLASSLLLLQIVPLLAVLDIAQEELPGQVYDCDSWLACIICTSVVLLRRQRQKMLCVLCFAALSAGTKLEPFLHKHLLEMVGKSPRYDMGSASSGAMLLGEDEQNQEPADFTAMGIFVRFEGRQYKVSNSIDVWHVLQQVFGHLHSHGRSAERKYSIGDLLLLPGGARLQTQQHTLRGEDAIRVWAYLQQREWRSQCSLQRPYQIPTTHLSRLSAQEQMAIHNTLALKHPGRSSTVVEVVRAASGSQGDYVGHQLRKGFTHESCTHLIRRALELCAAQAPVNTSHMVADLDADCNFIEALGLDSVACTLFAPAVSSLAEQLENGLQKLPSSFAYESLTIDSAASYLVTRGIEDTAIRFKDPAYMQVYNRNQERPSISVYGLGALLPGGVLCAADMVDIVTNRNPIATATDIPPWKAAYYDTDRHRAAPGKWLSCQQWEAVFKDLGQESCLKSQYTDPQHAAIMYAAVQAFELAQHAVGPDLSKLDKRRIGCVIGCTCHDFIACKHSAANPYFATGSQSAMLAGKVSRALGLEGPALTVDTACSSGLVALHMAIQSIQAGEIDGAIVAGVNLPLADGVFESLAHMNVLSKSGSSVPCSTSADGYVRADGAVALFIHKNLKGASSFATLGPCFLNQSSKSASLAAPDGNAQQRLIQATLSAAADAGIDITHVELHGSSTVMGDTIELEALSRAFSAAKHTKVKVSASKRMFGHTEGAAGLVGILCTIIEQQEEVRMSFCDPSSFIPLSSATLQVEASGEVELLLQVPNGSLQPAHIPPSSIVSSFGFSGTNACAIVMQDAFSKLRVRDFHTGSAVELERPLKAKPARRPEQFEQGGHAAAMHPQIQHEHRHKVMLLEKNWSSISATLPTNKASVAVQLGQISWYHCGSSPETRLSSDDFVRSRNWMPISSLSSESAYSSGAGLTVVDLHPAFAGHPTLEGFSKILAEAYNLLSAAGASDVLWVLTIGEVPSMLELQCSMWLEQLVLKWRQRVQTPFNTACVLHGMKRFNAAIAFFEQSRAQLAAQHIFRVNAEGVWVRTLEEVQPAQANANQPKLQVNATKAFVILGCGALAEIAVRWLHSQGAVKFLFISRSGRGAAVNLAESWDLQVQSELCDLTNIADVERTLANVRAAGEIGGFVHAAGQYFLDGDSCIDEQRVLKLFISDVLANVATAVNADFVLLLSSCAGFWPLRDTSEYAGLHSAMHSVAQTAMSQPLQRAVSPMSTILDCIGGQIDTVSAAPVVVCIALSSVQEGILSAAEHNLQKQLGVHAMQTSDVAQLLPAAIQQAAIWPGHEIGIASFSSTSKFGHALEAICTQGLPNYLQLLFGSNQAVTSPRQNLRFDDWLLGVQTCLQLVTGTLRSCLQGLDPKSIFSPESFSLDSLSCIEFLGQLESSGMGAYRLADLYAGLSFKTLFELTAEIQGSVELANAASKCTAETGSADTTHVAIVHSEVMLPGGISSTGQLGEHLLRGVPIWGPTGTPSPPKGEPGDIHAMFEPDQIQDCFSFVRSLRRFPEAELSAMDPHQAVLLYAVGQALSNFKSSHKPSGLPSHNGVIGTFIAGGNRDFLHGAQHTEWSKPSPYDALGQAASILADRVAFTFELTGPCCVYDAACASGLLAVHHACESLRSGLCDTAVVAGCNLILSSNATQMMHAMGVTAASSREFPLQKSAGYIRAEGCAVLILQQGRGVPSFPVISSARLTHSTTPTTSLSAPSPAAQEKLYPSHHTKTGIWAELHATGTVVGDRIEREVCEAWAAQHQLQLHTNCNKALLGHTEGTSGLVSILCALEGVRQTAGVSEAIVNSFGFGGSLAQVSLHVPRLSQDIPQPRLKGGQKFILVLPGQGSVKSGFLKSVYYSCAAASAVLEQLWTMAAESCLKAGVPCTLEDFRGLALEAGSSTGCNLHTNLCLEQLSALCFALLSVCLWRHACSKCDTVVMGHSLGQFAAAVLAGTMSPAESMHLVLLRLEHLHGGSADTAFLNSSMIAITAGEQLAEAILTRWSDGHHGLCVACINSPKHCTIAGPAAEITAFCSNLPDGIRSFDLPGVLAYHTPLAEQSAAQLVSTESAAASLAIVLCDGTLVEPGAQLHDCVWADLTKGQVDFPAMLRTATKELANCEIQVVDASLSGGFSVLIDATLNELGCDVARKPLWPRNQCQSNTMLSEALQRILQMPVTLPGSTNFGSLAVSHGCAAVPHTAAAESRAPLRTQPATPWQQALSDLGSSVPTDSNVCFDELLAESILRGSARAIAKGSVPRFLQRMHQHYAGVVEEESGAEQRARFGVDSASQKLLQHEIAVLNSVAPHVADFWNGKTRIFDILFPAGATDMVQPLYSDIVRAELLHRVMVERLQQHIFDNNKGGHVTVVELGSGTGSLTRPIISCLANMIDTKLIRGARLVLSDLGPSSLAQLRKRNLDLAVPAGLQLQYVPLDINSGVWGLEPGMFDLVLASNVLHVGLDLSALAERLRRLLRPRGKVLAREAQPSPFLDCTFGFLESWQLAADARKNHTALLLPTQWVSAMAPFRTTIVWLEDYLVGSSTEITRYTSKEFILQLTCKPGAPVDVSRAPLTAEGKPAWIETSGDTLAAGTLQQASQDDALNAYSMESCKELLGFLDQFALVSGAGALSMSTRLIELSIDSLGIAAVANALVQAELTPLSLVGVTEIMGRLFDMNEGNLADLAAKVFSKPPASTRDAMHQGSAPGATKKRIVAICPAAGCPAAAYRNLAARIRCLKPSVTVICLPCPSEFCSRATGQHTVYENEYLIHCCELILGQIESAQCSLTLYGHSLGAVHAAALLWHLTQNDTFVKRCHGLDCIISCPPPVNNGRLLTDLLESAADGAEQNGLGRWIAPDIKSVLSAAASNSWVTKSKVQIHITFVAAVFDSVFPGASSGVREAACEWALFLGAELKHTLLVQDHRWGIPE